MRTAWRRRMGCAGGTAMSRSGEGGEAEHLRCRSLVEPRWQAGGPDGLKKAGRAEAVGVAGVLGLVE